MVDLLLFFSHVTDTTAAVELQASRQCPCARRQPREARLRDRRRPIERFKSYREEAK